MKICVGQIYLEKIFKKRARYRYLAIYLPVKVVLLSPAVLPPHTSCLLHLVTSHQAVPARIATTPENSQDSLVRELLWHMP